jgi:hypothetical protein
MGSPLTPAATRPEEREKINSRTQKLTGYNFKVYQSGVGFKCPYSNRPFKPLTTFIDVWQGLFSGT